MRAVLQRVTQAACKIDGKVFSQIGPGLVILLAVQKGDRQTDAEKLARKTAHLRIFAGQDGKFRDSVLDKQGEAIVISQFTLYANVSAGRRPSFEEAEEPAAAEKLYAHYVRALAAEGVPVQTGRFGAMMQIELVNDGPVTVILDSEGR